MVCETEKQEGGTPVGGLIDPIVIRSPEDFIDRNIKTFIENAENEKLFGVSYVQRICRIGYSQACYTIAEMLDRQLITVDEVKEWKYTYRKTGA